MNDRRKVFLHLLWSHFLSFVCWLFRLASRMHDGWTMSATVPRLTTRNCSSS
ncbi:hypothetical protein P692DRAFT_20888612 [Suillus brevipes Sb2]|nr:hypothetical protein P692DRAFT_20888612 [Suillus brevipes Sb2]